jgi:hypothetical protein
MGMLFRTTFSMLLAKLLHLVLLHPEKSSLLSLNSFVWKALTFLFRRSSPHLSSRASQSSCAPTPPATIAWGDLLSVPVSSSLMLKNRTMQPSASARPKSSQIHSPNLWRCSATGLHQLTGYRQARPYIASSMRASVLAPSQATVGGGRVKGAEGTASKPHASFAGQEWATGCPDPRELLQV